MAEAGLDVVLRRTAPAPLSLSLRCAPGEMAALVGPSGSGKTTLLHLIAGLLRPVDGRITCNGTVWVDTARGIHIPAHRRAAGLVFQTYALFPHLTALGNVIAAMGHLPSALRAARAHALLATMHMQGLEHRRPHALSGGQQQRVALARALAREPDVLLLDEPFSALDRPTRRALRAEIAALRGITAVPILLVTHDVDEAAALADTMHVIDNGQLLRSGPPCAVMRDPDPRLRALLDLR